MADVSKLKKSRRLGPPPAADEASDNLSAPEVAPAGGTDDSDGYQRLDGRTLRKTNRTVPFATRVSPRWDKQVRDIAARDGLKLVEVLERALDAYEAQRDGDHAAR